MYSAITAAIIFFTAYILVNVYEFFLYILWIYTILHICDLYTQFKGVFMHFIRIFLSFKSLSDNRWSHHFIQVYKEGTMKNEQGMNIKEFL